MQTQVPTKKINKSSFGDPQKKKKVIFQTPLICEVLKEGRRDFDFGLLILLSYVSEQLCGESYFLICENLM